ncbi:MAG: 1-acyl-sn-glycerol-3-phosphate acyltransferase [Verrucomicrobia bacterium]|nr:1-acyl-sn-glycerol-3-phosphate acyltransferase [Verrucomicrobiota bacterium]
MMDNPAVQTEPQRTSSRFWRAFVHSRAVQRVFVWTAKVLFRLRVRNMERALPPGPYIFASNHASHYDLFLALAAFAGVTGQLPVPVVWSGVFDIPVIGNILRAMTAVAVRHGRGDELDRAATVQEMISLVRAGHCLVMACEGIRNDALGLFEQGAAFTSLATGVPVVPVSLRGAQGLFSDLSGPRRFWGNVEIVLHPPLDPAEFEAAGGSQVEVATRFTQAIRDQVASELDYPVADVVARTGNKPVS